MKAEMEQVKEEARGTQAKMRGLEVKVRKMKKMKPRMREMRERMRQLEDHNAQLSAALHQQLQPQRSSLQTVGLRLGPSSSTTWLGGRGEEGVWSEMLWCFPFLKHYGDILPGSFVVDDHQKAVHVIAIRDGRPAVTFANHEFCQTTGYSLAELFDHNLATQLSQPSKASVIKAYMDRCQLGMSEILHCSFMIEHKQGHMVATSARLQFCFVNTVHYCVLVVDQVLGTMEVPNTLSDVAAKETKEWAEAIQAVLLADSGTQDSLVEQGQAIAAEDHPSWSDLCNTLSPFSPPFSPL